MMPHSCQCKKKCNMRGTILTTYFGIYNVCLLDFDPNLKIMSRVIKEHHTLSVMIQFWLFQIKVAKNMALNS